jgi:hypothetical protein
MSTTPPTISPRLRSRESGSLPATRAASSAASTAHSNLRVLIRLPHIAAESKASARFQVAVGLLAAMKRSYAAAAFAVFLVGMVLMLLHGKSADTTHSEADSDAPRWNSAATAPAGQQAPSVRQVPAASAIRSGQSPSPTSVPTAQPTVQQRPVEPLRQGMPASPTATVTTDRIPPMPRINPSRESMAERGPAWSVQPSGPVGNPSVPNLR